MTAVGPAFRTPKNFFEGIDFASGQARVGRCYLIDDEKTLTVAMDRPTEGECIRAAIDCPLGTTVGFTQLLAGELPGDNRGGFKSRETEAWLRNQVAAFGTTVLWRNKSRGIKKVDRVARYKGVTYFNRTGHIQPAVEMTIVPECLWWMGNRLCADGNKSERLGCLVKARTGDGPVVEAHPRMFLYSLIEKVWRSDPAHVTLDTLFATVRYKESADHRRLLYRLIREQTCWMDGSNKTICPVDAPDCLINSDHMFDGFLSALTAFSHHRAGCVNWQAAGIAKDVVEIEGHILVLKQAA